MLGENNLHMPEGIHLMKETGKESQPGPILEGLGNQDREFRYNEGQEQFSAYKTSWSDFHFLKSLFGSPMESSYRAFLGLVGLCRRLG